MKYVFLLLIPMFIVAKDYKLNKIVSKAQSYNVLNYNFSDLKFNLVLIDKKTKTVTKKNIEMHKKLKNGNKEIKFLQLENKSSKKTQT